MQIFKQISSLFLQAIVQKPAIAAGVVIFSLGFVLVAGNALYFQQGPHKDPISSTSKDTESLSSVKQSAISKVNSPNSITRSVLTQRVSVKNIPVPTVNPARSNSVVAQSSLVRDIQSVLLDIGFYDGKVDGIYGDGTKSAIMTFQKRADIIPNGEASYELLSNLKAVQAVTGSQRKKVEVVEETQVSSISKPVVFDADTVTRIQAGLKENFGDENISVDGVMGNQTKNAIKRFQKRFKIKATGELDKITLDKMHSVGILNSI